MNGEGLIGIDGYTGFDGEGSEGEVDFDIEGEDDIGLLLPYETLPEIGLLDFDMLGETLAFDGEGSSYLDLLALYDTSGLTYTGGSISLVTTGKIGDDFEAITPIEGWAAAEEDIVLVAANAIV